MDQRPSIPEPRICTPTKLQGANLTGARLNGAKLRGAKYNDATQFPDGFDPANHAMVFDDEEDAVILNGVS